MGKAKFFGEITTQGFPLSDLANMIEFGGLTIGDEGRIVGVGGLDFETVGAIPFDPAAPENFTVEVGISNREIMERAISQGGGWTGNGKTFGVVGSIQPSLPLGSILTIFDTTILQLDSGGNYPAGLNTLWFTSAQNLSFFNFHLIRCPDNVDGSSFGIYSPDLDPEANSGLRFDSCENLFLSNCQVEGDGIGVMMYFESCRNITHYNTWVHDGNWANSVDLGNEGLFGVIHSRCGNIRIFGGGAQNLTGQTATTGFLPIPYNTDGWDTMRGVDNLSAFGMLFQNMGNATDNTNGRPATHYNVSYRGCRAYNCVVPWKMIYNIRQSGFYDCIAVDSGPQGFALGSGTPDVTPANINLTDCSAINTGSLPNPRLPSSTAGFLLVDQQGGFARGTTLNNCRAYANLDTNRYLPSKAVRPTNFCNFYVGPLSTVVPAAAATGTGYTTASVMIDPPDVAGGIQATATANIVGTSITSYNLTNPGSGYVKDPIVRVTGDGSGAQAVAPLPVANGNAYQAAFRDWEPGEAYDAGDVVTFRAWYYVATVDHVSGAFFKVDRRAGKWSEGVQVANNLTWLTTLPTWNNGGLGLGIKSFRVATQGSGYAPGNVTVTISAPNLGGGIQATGHVVAGSDGKIILNSFVVDNPGTGYTALPTGTVGGAGTGAVLVAIGPLSGGETHNDTAGIPWTFVGPANQCQYMVSGLIIDPVPNPGDLEVNNIKIDGNIGAAIGNSGTAQGSFWFAPYTTFAQSGTVLTGAGATNPPVWSTYPSIGVNFTNDLGLPRIQVTGLTSASVNHNVALGAGAKFILLGGSNPLIVGAFSIDSLAYDGNERMIWLYNYIAQNMTIVNRASVTFPPVTAGNQIATATGANVTLNAAGTLGSWCQFMYLGNANLWQLMASGTFV